MAAPLDIVLRLSGMEELQQGLDKTLKSVQDLGNKLTSAGTTLSLAVTAPIVAFAAMGVQELSSVQAAMAQTEAVIKSTGGVAGVSAKGVRELSESLQGKSAVDAEVIQSGANLLLTFTNIRNVAGKNNDIFNRATKLSLDLSRAFGQDVSSSAIQLGKALNDPINGITALSRVGIQFTEVGKAQIKTLVESGKTLEAQKIILAELETQVGGSAEAFRNTMGGSLALMKTQIEDVTGSLSQALAPAIINILAAASDWLTWFNSLDKGTKSMIATIGVLVAAIGPLLLVVGQAIKIFGVLSKTLSFAMNMNPWILAIGALVIAGIRLYQNWDTVASIAKTVWNYIKQTVLIAVELMLEALNQFTGWIPGWGTMIGKAAESVTAMRISVEKDMAAIQEPMVNTSKDIAETGNQLKNLANAAPPTIDNIKQLSKEEQKLIEKQKELNESLGKIIVNLQLSGANVGDLINQFVRGGGPLKETKTLVEYLYSAWKKNNEWVGENIVTEQNQRNELFKLVTELHTLENQVVNSGLSISDLTKDIKWSDDASENLKAMISALTDGLKDNKKSVAELNASYGAQILKAQSLGINVGDLIDKLKITGTTTGDLMLIMAALNIIINKVEGSTKNVITTQSLYEKAVQGVAESIKGIWNGTTTTFKDVWHGALNTFVDVFAQMVIQAQITGQAISASMAAATAGISLVVGLLGMAFGGKKNKIEVVPLTERLKKIFDDFVGNFKSAIGDFKEYLFPAKGEAKSSLQQILSFASAISTLSVDLKQIKEMIRESPLEVTPDMLALFQKAQKTSTQLGYGKVSNIKHIEGIIVATAKKLSESAVEFSSLMIERFNKIKGIVDDIVGLYTKQKDFVKDVSKSITDIQRDLLSPQEMLTAQLADVETLKAAIGAAAGEEQIALLGELKGAYLAVWGTAKDLFGQDTAKLVEWQKFTVDGLESVKESGKTAYDRLIDVNMEILGVQRTGIDLQTQMTTYLSNLGGKGGLIDQTNAALLEIGRTNTTTEAQTALLTSAFAQLFGIPKLAHGGIVSKPTLAMIGEAGTEVVIPLTKPGRASEIMQEAGLSGGGNNISMTQVFRGPVILDKISMSKWVREQSKLMKREMMRYA